jgi:hypothetical protein
MDIHKSIIERIKEQRDDSDDVLITINELCSLMPDFPKDQIVSALIDMEDIEVTDSHLGGIRIPSHYFSE